MLDRKLFIELITNDGALREPEYKKIVNKLYEELKRETPDRIISLRLHLNEIIKIAEKQGTESQQKSPQEKNYGFYGLKEIQVKSAKKTSEQKAQLLRRACEFYGLTNPNI